MTPQEPKPTAGGVLGKLAGKVKEVAGEFAGNRSLAREGRLQDAAGDAELKAQRKGAEAAVREQRARVEEEHAAVHEERARLRSQARQDRAEEQADAERFRREAEAARLEASADRIEQQGGDRS